MTDRPRQLAVIIEDDDGIRQLIAAVFEQLGFDAIGVSNGIDGVAAVRSYDPVVTTLDVNMPGIDGFETAKRIRAFSPTYLVMVTARDEEIDTLQGLGAGADDFVVKPFRPRELRARIEAMLRRPRAGAPSTAQAPSAPVEAAPAPTSVAPPVAPPSAPVDSAPIAAPVAPAAAEPVGFAQPIVVPAAGERAVVAGEAVLRHNGVALDPETRLVELDSAGLDLTRSEFDLLEALLRSGRRVRSKTDLALLLRGESYITSHYVSEADRRGVEVHIANLRKKLSDDAASPRIIETVRGVGYRLTAPQD